MEGLWNYCITEISKPNPAQCVITYCVDGRMVRGSANMELWCIEYIYRYLLRS
jgi:hypothetical protein